MRPKRTHLELASGRYLDYTDPRPEDMSLEDITLALSNCCRWGGHCPEFYSVAEHACLVHDIVRAWHGDTATCLAALHLEAERFKPSQGRTWAGRPAVVELPAGVEWACGLSPARSRGAFLGRHRALTSGR